MKKFLEYFLRAEKNPKNPNNPVLWQQSPWNSGIRQTPRTDKQRCETCTTPPDRHLASNHQYRR